MRLFDRPLLISVLLDARVCQSFDMSAWGILLRQARAANVLGRTLLAIDQQFPAEHWPLRIQQAFAAEHNLAQHRTACLQWELGEIAGALKTIGVRPVLLKGAAYLAGGFPFASYRAFGDIDILVPHAKLAEVEKRLVINGWVSTKQDAYDQAYYRRWMHELPPMQHMHRGTTLDVHHNILPLTARYRPDHFRLIEAVQPLPLLPSVDVLAPEDMFLHAATHLFCEGEGDNSLRNLLDLMDLLLYHTRNPGFSHENLVNRAIEMDLLVPLALAARYLERIFELTEARGITQLMSNQGVIPGFLAFRDLMFDSIFRGFNTEQSSIRLAIARQMLFLRSHYLRMPLYLLLPHLFRKSLRSKENSP